MHGSIVIRVDQAGGMICIIFRHNPLMVKRRMMKFFFSVCFSALLLMAAAEASAACNECHSKNPKMVRMHEALQFRDCFKCHGLGQMKKGEEQKTQMVTDQRCVACHGK